MNLNFQYNSYSNGNFFHDKYKYECILQSCCCLNRGRRIWKPTFQSSLSTSSYIHKYHHHYRHHYHRHHHQIYIRPLHLNLIEGKAQNEASGHIKKVSETKGIIDDTYECPAVLHDHGTVIVQCYCRCKQCLSARKLAKGNCEDYDSNASPLFFGLISGFKDGTASNTNSKVYRRSFECDADDEIIVLDKYNMSHLVKYHHLLFSLDINSIFPNQTKRETILKPAKSQKAVLDVLAEIKKLSLQLFHQWNTKENVQNLWTRFRSSPSIELCGKDISHALMNENSIEAHHILAGHLLLISNRKHFKFVSCSKFVPQSLEEVEQDQTLATDDETLAAFASFIYYLIHGRNEKSDVSPTAPPVFDIYFNKMRQFIVWPADPDFRNIAVAVLTRLNLRISPLNAYEILKKCGQIPWNEIPPIFRFSQIHFPVRFSTEDFQCASSLISKVPSDCDDSRRVHVSEAAIAIDCHKDASTEDCLQITRDSSGIEWINIHISDVSRYIAPGSELDILLRKRCISTYSDESLPGAFVSMCPSNVRRNLLSLRERHNNYSLCFRCTISSVGEVQRFEIFPAVVETLHKLTYEETRSMIHCASSEKKFSPEILNQVRRLLFFAEIRKEYRRSRGGGLEGNTEQYNRTREFSNPECFFDISNSVSDPASHSLGVGGLVKEMMLLAGEISSYFCRTHKLSVPYLRRNSPSCSFSLFPEDVYGLSGIVPVTNPVRKYCDLLSHFQIKAHIRGDPPPFSESEVHDIITRSRRISYDIESLRRSCISFDFLSHLENRLKDTLEKGEDLILICKVKRNLRFPPNVIEVIHEKYNKQHVYFKVELICQLKMATSLQLCIKEVNTFFNSVKADIV